MDTLQVQFSGKDEDQFRMSMMIDQEHPMIRLWINVQCCGKGT